jgi:ATP:ADP antiporter, AAA family
MSKKLKRLLGCLTEIRADEARIIVPIALAYGLVMASLYVLKPARNALFLDRLGVAQLPYVLLLVALVGGAAAMVFSRFVVVVHLNRLILSTFVGLIGCLGAFWLLLPLGLSWSYYLFYVWVNLYGLMTTSLLWLLAGTLFNARQARRLFGLIGTSGIGGAILGGAATGRLAGAVGTENLLLICMALLSLVLVLLYFARPGHDISPSSGESSQGAIAAITASQLLRLLAGMAGIMALVAAVVDVQFNDIIERTITDKDAKTAFFGNFFAYLSIFAFFFQIFLTPRILRSLGVTSALLVLPLSLGLGSAAILVAPGLLAAILAKIGDGGLRHSIHKSASEILFLPLPPETKKRTKVLLDTTVDNLATGLGALLVLLLTGLGVAYNHMALLSLGLVAVWIFLVLKSREAYIDSFRQALERRDIDLGEFTVDITEAATLDGLVTALDSSNPRRLVYALDMLSNVRAKRLITTVERLLDHSEPEVRQKALIVLAGQSDSVSVDKIRALSDDDDDAVRTEALHCLLVHGEGDRLQRLHLALHEGDARTRAAALGTIALYGNAAERALVDTQILDALCDSSDPEDRIQAAKILGALDAESLRPYLDRLMADPNPAVGRQAIASVGRLRHPEDLPWLAERLDDRRFRLQARQALAAYGPEALAPLVDRLDQAKDLVSRNNIARALGRLPYQQTVDILWERIGDGDPSLQYLLLKSLSKLRQAQPDLFFDPKHVDAGLRQAATDYYRLLQAATLCNGTGDAEKLLGRALAEKQAQQLKRLSRLLGLRYAAKDMHHAYLGLSGGQPDLRASALEFLENVLERRHKELLVPLLEAENATIAIAAGQSLFGERFADADVASAYLLAHPDPWLRACAAYRLAVTSPDSVDALRPLADDPHPLVRETARRALSPG